MHPHTIASTGKTMAYIHFIGIDVSKDTFEAAVHGQAARPARFPNSSAGVAAFVKAFAAHLPEAFVVVEATGGYETALLTALLEQGVAVHRADPRVSSFFLRSLGRRAKTDRLDAQGLARYGAERHTALRRYRLPDDEQQRLHSLMARRADLMAMRTAEMNRRQHPRYRELRASVQSVLATLEKQIALLDRRIDTLVHATAALATKMQVMIAVPGVGRQTAATLLAFMPELGMLTRRQAASLAGCAPHPRDSGKTNGYRRTVGGRAQVRRALYMAAMAARNHHPDLRAFYENLIENGKKPLVALTAVMRKLITIINARLRDHSMSQTW